jgi:hypothetical protein
MVSSSAHDPETYLAELAPERAAEIAAVRDLVNDSVPDGLEETMQYGMLSWVVPLATYPEPYNGQPLAYVALAAQKNYNSLYLMTVYSAAGRMDEDEFRARWAGPTRLDMGKSCVRFRAAADLDQELIREVLSGCTVADFVAAAEAARSR